MNVLRCAYSVAVPRGDVRRPWHVVVPLGTPALSARRGPFIPQHITLWSRRPSFVQPVVICTYIRSQKDWHHLFKERKRTPESDVIYCMSPGFPSGTHQARCTTRYTALLARCLQPAEQRRAAGPKLLRAACTTNPVYTTKFHTDLLSGTGPWDAARASATALHCPLRGLLDCSTTTQLPSLVQLSPDIHISSIEAVIRR